jgi:TonB family protein
VDLNSRSKLVSKICLLIKTQEMNTQRKLFSASVMLILAVTVMLITKCASKLDVVPPSEPYTEVDVMPVFPGGDEGLLKYIATNVAYPLEAKQAGTQGRVVTKFCVTSNGSIDRVSVLKGVSPELDAEAIRVVSGLPPFQPGRQDNRNVDVWYVVPITFTLSGTKGADQDAYKPFRSGVEEPFVVVEEMPMFPGGDSALLDFITTNIQYPEEAKTAGIEGRVIVRFCVTAEGKTSMVSVLKGVHPSVDKEAMRVVSSLPAFVPGKQGGVAVPVWYMVPVTFALQ